MIRFLADENFDNDIVRGLQRRMPLLDLVRVQDVGLRRADDPTVLEWAASEGRVVLTHDVRTMTKFAIDRVQSDQVMPGLIEASSELPIGTVIADLILILECGTEDDLNGQIVFLPL